MSSPHRNDHLRPLVRLARLLPSSMVGLGAVFLLVAGALYLLFEQVLKFRPFTASATVTAIVIVTCLSVFGVLFLGLSYLAES